MWQRLTEEETSQLNFLVARHLAALYALVWFNFFKVFVYSRFCYLILFTVYHSLGFSFFNNISCSVKWWSKDLCRNICFFFKYLPTSRKLFFTFASLPFFIQTYVTEITTIISRLFFLKHHHLCLLKKILSE